MNRTTYTGKFFETIRAGARSSANEVVPIILQLVQPKSVVDIGCGDGTWLSVFRDQGVLDIVGLDGDYVNPELLQIAPDQFRPTDLSSPFELCRTFDLAVSLEVAEHLPPQSAEGFVHSLTELAPVSLFSAAIPLQGGTQHLNEQWPDYWSRLFKIHNYLTIDCVRGRIWGNEQVEWFYAQNMLLFVHEDRLRGDAALCRHHDQTKLQQLALVHPKRFVQPFRCGVRAALRLLAVAAANAVRKRIRVLPGERY
ncbi:MAG: methyltransferase domain-containing protein [Ktedonobacteraceae bacterium]|nr:methyltransferase domain-containing protein [Ktedonobacteraceae bacterium]